MQARPILKSLNTSRTGTVYPPHFNPFSKVNTQLPDVSLLSPFTELTSLRMPNSALHHHTLTSTSGEYTRDVWFLPGPSEIAHPLCVFLDAEFYLQRMEGAAILSELMSRRSIPPCACLFVSNHSAEARHYDYTWNDPFAKFIAQDVVAWARNRISTIEGSENLIGGLSLSGLAAAHLALTFPDVFSAALCQSGSFWWLHERGISFPPTVGRFWISVGDGETEADVTHPPTGLYQAISQIEGVQLAADRLKASGGTIKFNTYTGGHSIEPWREELPTAMEWLMSGQATE